MRTSVPPLGRNQGPNDDAHQPHGVPAIGELLVGFDDQNFGIDYAVPIGHGCGAEIEPMAHDGLEVVVHQPLLDQRTLRESAPDLLRRVRQFFLDHQRARSQSLVHPLLEPFAGNRCDARTMIESLESVLPLAWRQATGILPKRRASCSERECGCSRMTRCGRCLQKDKGVPRRRPPQLSRRASRCSLYRLCPRTTSAVHRLPVEAAPTGAGAGHGPSIDCAARGEGALGRGDEKIVARKRHGGEIRSVQAVLFDGP